MSKAIQKEDYTRVIYDKGCLRAGEEWVERNLVPVAGVAVAISVLQVAKSVAISVLQVAISVAKCSTCPPPATPVLCFASF